MGTTTAVNHPHRGAPARGVFASPKLRDPSLASGRSAHERRRKVAHGAWRQLVLCRAEWIRHEVARAVGQDSPSASHILELAHTSTEVALKPGGLVTWFEGCQQERAWLTLHEAEAEVIELLTGEELRVHAQDIMRKAHRQLGPQDERLQCVASALDECPAVPDERLAPRVAHLARATFEAMDDRYAQSRGFRNRLVRVSGLALLGVLALVVATSVSGLYRTDAQADPLAGWKTSLVIALFGAVGALVSAVPPLAKAQGTRNPFSLPLFQCLLKLVMGPLFAFVGLLLMQAGIVTGLEAADSLMKLALWATVFGAGQQTVTHFIDQRLSGMLTSAADPGPAPKKPSRAHEPGRTGPLPTAHTPSANGQSGGEAPSGLATT